VADFAANGPERLGRGGIGVLDRLSGGAEKGNSSRRERDTAAIPFEQPGANLGFQGTDALTERWLGQVHSLGRAAKMQVLRQGDEAGKRANVHGFS
jgi:hypothetical protein